MSPPCAECGKDYEHGVYGVFDDAGFTVLKICMECWDKRKKEKEVPKE